LFVKSHLVRNEKVKTFFLLGSSVHSSPVLEKVKRHSVH
jgi:hypothetical protein